MRCHCVSRFRWRFVPFAANAADYDPPIVVDDPDEYVPVESRLRLVSARQRRVNFNGRYKDTSFGVDNSLFYNDLLGPGSFGALDLFSFDESENPVSGSIGFGYHFNDYLRADLNIRILRTTTEALRASLRGYSQPILPGEFAQSIGSPRSLTSDAWGRGP